MTQFSVICSLTHYSSFFPCGLSHFSRLAVNYSWNLLVPFYASSLGYVLHRKKLFFLFIYSTNIFNVKVLSQLQARLSNFQIAVICVLFRLTLSVEKKSFFFLFEFIFAFQDVRQKWVKWVSNTDILWLSIIHHNAINTQRKYYLAKEKVCFFLYY